MHGCGRVHIFPSIPFSAKLVWIKIERLDMIITMPKEITILVFSVYLSMIVAKWAYHRIHNIRHQDINDVIAHVTTDIKIEPLQ